MKRLFFFFLLMLVTQLAITQTVNGTVIDAKSKQPLQDVSVYFDATTIGTITNKNGVFNLLKKENVNTPLVISYLGYKTITLNPSQLTNNLKVELEISDFELDEVILSDDTWSREKKLKHFKREFLGKHQAALDCEILNVDHINLYYSSVKQILYASSDQPIVVKNKYLGYNIYYQISEFEIHFKNINNVRIKSDGITRSFELVNFVLLTGYSRFENINPKRVKSKYLKRREQQFKVSSLYFMRSLSENKLIENGFRLYIKDPSGKSNLFFETLTDRVFKIEKNDNKATKITFIKPQRVTVSLINLEQASIIPNQDHFFIDDYGVFFPIKNISFSGAFGKERLSVMLPLNYNL